MTAIPEPLSDACPTLPGPDMADYVMIGRRAYLFDCRPVTSAGVIDDLPAMIDVGGEAANDLAQRGDLVDDDGRRAVLLCGDVAVVGHVALRGPLSMALAEAWRQGGDAVGLARFIRGVVSTEDPVLITHLRDYLLAQGYLIGGEGRVLGYTTADPESHAPQAVAFYGLSHLAHAGARYPMALCLACADPGSFCALDERFDGPDGNPGFFPSVLRARRLMTFEARSPEALEAIARRASALCDDLGATMRPGERDVRRSFSDLLPGN